MMNVRRAITTAAICASAAVFVAAQTVPNVKVGLWEMTTTMDLSGMMGSVDMSKIPPDQQPMVQAMMARGGMPPQTSQTCITKEKLAHANFNQDRPGMKCTSKISKSTTSIMDWSESCTDTTNPKHTSTAEMHAEASSPTTVKITGKVTDTGGAMGGRSGSGPQTASFSISGKWLAEACGDVK